MFYVDIIVFIKSKTVPLLKVYNVDSTFKIKFNNSLKFKKKYPT